jgi:ABC-type antimicrobial peptide transport system permease subunit
MWPGQDPVGKRFTRGGNPDEQGFEVVGVVADARMTSIERTPPLMVYVPYWWRSRASTSLLVRTHEDPASALPAIRHVVQTIDPEIAIGAARPLERIVEASTAGRRYQMTLFVTFAGAALAIAMVGVYAVTAYGVTRRRREMNIRAALGAKSSQILELIVRQTGVPVAAGAVAGAVAALAISGLVASLLFDVPARDPVIVGAVVALVGTAGLVTCVLAARKGLRIDPAAALREE